MNDIYLKFAMKPMMIERRSFEWLAAHMSSNKAFKPIKPSLAHDGSNNIAIIPIHGILTKRSGIFDGMLGMTSYDEIQKQISAALSDDAVQTILLDIDSPGGETSGLFDLADFIYQARSQKTIWAVCNDEAYSAAYGIASSAEKVFINRTSGVGSIGVIATHIDQSAFDEKQGVKYTTVFAGNRKNDLNPHEPLTSESMQTLQSEVSRFNEDSCLIYCGRKDNQIKLRGFRIELEEIESRISLIKDVKKTAVIYCPSKEKIYAFVVCELSQETIKSLLSDTLPDYMLPTIIKIDNLPLNNSGKIDRSKLKEMVDHIDRSESKSGHDNVLEIISNILKIETSKLDLDKSFFELGGDSLLATRFLFEVQKAFNVKLIFRDIMSSINIRELINKITDQKRRLYPWENKFITFEEINPKTGTYILAYAFKYQKGFSFIQLKEAFTKLVHAFPILKT
jgi:acyl carrier protein/nitrogen regulatory protein PII-like uncharacterized protein